MELIVANDYKDLSKTAAELVKKKILKNPSTVLCFPTGSTPLGLYQALAKMAEEKKLDFSNIITFNLDEFVGVKKTDRNSYYNYMQGNFFSKVKLSPENIHFLNGDAKDLDAECMRYERELKEHPIDLLLCGIGENGHIGFNEPGTSFDSVTHEVKLTLETIKHNKCPKTALTIGLKSIMNAKEILLLANGKDKANIIKRLIEGEANEKLPASILQEHKKCTILVDRDAAFELDMILK